VKAAVEATGAAVGVNVRSATPRKDAPRGRHRALTGVVRSDKMDKTVVVEVVSLRRDPVYGKYLKNRTRYKAHDEKNQYKTGDKVEITEHRPLSREKRWIVSRLLEAAKVE
jgi:small subunit ribosomal protein S17